MKIRQNLAENKINLAVLFGDDTSFTGLHFEIDEVEFASECDSNNVESLQNGSNNDSIVTSHVDDIVWYSHSIVFPDSNLETANEINIEYYFDPLLEPSACKTYSTVETVYTGCGWNNIYKNQEQLIIYI